MRMLHNSDPKSYSLNKCLNRKNKGCRYKNKNWCNNYRNIPNCRHYYENDLNARHIHRHNNHHT